MLPQHHDTTESEICVHEVDALTSMTALEGRKKSHSRLDFGISVDLPSDEGEPHTTNAMNAISMMHQFYTVGGP